MGPQTKINVDGIFLNNSSYKNAFWYFLLEAWQGSQIGGSVT